MKPAADRRLVELTRYVDVLAALRNPELSPVGPLSDDLPAPSAHAEMRAAALEAFSPARIARWRTIVRKAARELIHSLPSHREVDIIASFAEPWTRTLALTVTAVDAALAPRLCALARDIFNSSAEPGDQALKQKSDLATPELDRLLANAAIPLAAPTFVALTQTLVCLLGCSWLALIQHPDQLAELRAAPELLPRAVEELLRYIPIPTTLYRTAADERITLCIAAANRDPDRFPHPDRLIIKRRVYGHLSLGAGPHSCVGASLIRMAIAVSTAALLERLISADPEQAIEWRGGSAVRGPSALNAILA